MCDVTMGSHSHDFATNSLCVVFIFIQLFSWQDIEAFYSSLTHFSSLDELFPPTTTVFMVGNPYYGAMGEVRHLHLFFSFLYPLITE